MQRSGIFSAGLATVVALAGVAAAADCNGNGADDALDIAPADPGFATPRTACIEEPPRDLAAADLDGDGDRDVAIARAFGITLLSNGGKADLARLRDIPIGSDPVAIAAADLDGDGDGDLVTANGSGRPGTIFDGNVSVLLSRGDGSFLPPRNQAIGVEPIELALADLDADEDLDVAVANASSGDVSVLLNGGDGVLGPQARILLGDAPPLRNPRDMTAADFDQDGDIDIMTVQDGVPEEAFLLLNDALGGFPEIRGLELDPALPPMVIAAADVEGDGDIDLFFGVSEGIFTGQVLLALNQGRGTFDAPSLAAAGGQPIDLAVDDLDGDSDPDLAVVQDRNGELSLHRNDRGRFEESARAPLVGPSPALTAADMSGDGLVDLVTCDLDTLSVAIIPSTRKGKLLGPTTYPLRGPEQLLVADLDRDGYPELIAHGDPGAVFVWRNESRGDFRAPLEHVIDPGPHEVMAPDLDGDGDLDVAVTTRRGLNVLENAGELRFGPPFKYAVGDELTLAVPADLDGDGVADIAAVGPQLAGVLILLNSGSGELVKGPLVSTPNVESALDVLAADADGDGDNDLVLPNRGAWNGSAIADSHVAILENQGGAFEVARRPLDSFPLDASSGDLDGDGLLDLALSLAGCPNCSPRLDPSTIVLLSGGDGGYREERRFFTRGQPLWVLIEDLEGDGAPDVIMSLQDAGEIAVLLNSGGATFAPPAAHSIDLPAISLAALDADVDGDLDLAASTVASRASQPCRPAPAGALRLLPNDGRGSFGPPIVAESPEALFSLTAADLDGDALPEVAAFGEKGIAVFWNVTRPATSLDRNRNGVPDECEGVFRRGDASGDGRIDVSDPIRLLEHLHRGGPEPGCLDAADADDSGRLDITDAVVILEYLFRSGPPPPGPANAACGPDPTEPPDLLACEMYPPCV